MGQCDSSRSEPGKAVTAGSKQFALAAVRRRQPVPFPFHQPAQELGLARLTLHFGAVSLHQNLQLGERHDVDGVALDEHISREAKLA